jgi:hypothetical protein
MTRDQWRWMKASVALVAAAVRAMRRGDKPEPAAKPVPKP